MKINVSMQETKMALVTSVNSVCVQMRHAKLGVYATSLRNC